MGEIVCNTGPIIAFACVRRLDILRHLYGEVQITEAVRDEILEGGPGTAEFERELKAGWIHAHPVKGEDDPLLDEVLDPGEASVILLAMKRARATVLIDERKGRKVARDVYGLSVIGTVRVLLDAKEAGLVSHVGEMLQAMRSRGYWLSDRIVEAATRAAGESRCDETRNSG